MTFLIFFLFGKDKTQGPFQRGGTLAYTAPERLDPNQIAFENTSLNNSTNPTTPTSKCHNSTTSAQEPSESSSFSICMSTTSATNNSYLSKNSISITDPTKSVKDGTGLFKARKYWPLSI